MLKTSQLAACINRTGSVVARNFVDQYRSVIGLGKHCLLYEPKYMVTEGVSFCVKKRPIIPSAGARKLLMAM